MTAAELAAFVDDERACCPFLSFAVEPDAEPGTIRLRITGPEGARTFLSSELALTGP